MAKTTPSSGTASGKTSSAAPKPGANPSPAVMPTYARQNLVFERGEGPWLVTFSGERFLDCASGVAVNALGHAHPRLIAALAEQAGRVWHTSNLYRVAGQERLAERLVELTFADKVFFCNSGAEACEGAVKLARRYQFVTGHPERYRIITFKGAFHGRTMAMLAATGNEKYLEGFGPPAPGFDQIALDSIESVEKAILPETAAIMIEPVQGEGGVRTIEPEMLKGLRALCDRHGLLLVLDEVQSGMGRTGRLFAHEWAGIAPDVMAVAKGIGGGFPLGAFLATEKAAQGMTAGMHGSTFGGNPLATAVGNAVLDEIASGGFLEAVQQKGLKLRQGLARLKDQHPDRVDEVRGQGLLAGIRVRPPAGDVVKAAIEERLLTVAAGDNVVRVLPPLNIPDADLAEAVERLSRALARVAVAAA